MNNSEIFISEVNESVGLGIVVEGDEHSIWAYLLDTKGQEQELSG